MGHKIFILDIRSIRLSLQLWTALNILYIYIRFYRESRTLQRTKENFYIDADSFSTDIGVRHILLLFE